MKGTAYLEEVEVVQGGRMRLGATEADHDDTDQRGNGEHVGREDTRDSTCFAHGECDLIVCLKKRGMMVGKQKQNKERR